MRRGPGAAAAIAAAIGVLMIAALVARKAQRPVDLTKYTLPPTSENLISPDSEMEAENSLELVESPAAEAHRAEAPSQPATAFLPEFEPSAPEPASAPAPALELAGVSPSLPGNRKEEEPNWALLATRSDLWPRTVRLREDTLFIYELPGQTPGSIVIPAGSEVSVANITGDQVQVTRGRLSAVLDAESTNLPELVRDLDFSKSSAPKSSPPATPTPAPQLPAPKQRFVLRDGWDRPPQGPEVSSWTELLFVLRPHTVPSARHEVEESPEIYAGVRMLTPIAEALKTWELAWGAVPPPQPSPNPAIPFYLRTFRVPASPAHPLFAESGDTVHSATVLTDAEDRVVALELVSELPKTYRPALSELTTYRFPLNRRKVLASHKVGLDVSESGQVLVIGTWLADERKQQCHEAARLYLPRPLANLLRGNLEQGLMAML